jgi:DNA-binding HxlR family transcriptional regulator
LAGTCADTCCMKDYAQYCPVALASSVIAERWTPLIIRELVLGGRRFN